MQESCGMTEDMTKGRKALTDPVLASQFPPVVANSVQLFYIIFDICLTSMRIHGV